MRAAEAGQGLGACLGGHGRDRLLQALRGLRRQAQGAEQAAAARDLGHAGEHLGGPQLAVAAGPEHGQDQGPALGQRRRAGHAHGIAQGAAEARLVAVGEHVAADVDQHDEVAVQVVGRGGDAGAHRVGARVGIDQDDRLAESARPSAPRRSGRRRRSGCRGRPAPPRGRGARRRRPRPAGAVPGSGSMAERSQVVPPSATSGAAGADQLGHRQGAHHVAAAADAEAQGAPRPLDEGVEAGQLRRRRVRRRRRSPRSPPRRGRTRRRRAPACPRRAARAAAPATSGSRRTRPAP